MKKLLSALLVLMLAMAAMAVPAMADADDLLKIDVSGGAYLYDSYDLDEARPIALIPKNSICLHIATVDWGYCVAFGNYVGYIDEDDAHSVDSRYYYFKLPTGEDYSIQWSDDVSYVPEFPYYPIDCAGNQKISTRSGPSGDYTEHGSIQVGHPVEILYQTSNGGNQWCCIEFERDYKMYRVYTTMYRVNVDAYVPDDSEDYVWVHIQNGHTPRLGPGYQYASCGNYVPAYTEVKGYYQQDGWLMYDFTLPNGDIQRGWAEPGDWY
ncbi:MAG: hypothetical protein IJE08_05875 [Clostridia bacterium]|nr:hypothetical protein [Clostridia bacterium]